MIRVDATFEGRLTQDYLRAVGKNIADTEPLLEAWGDYVQGTVFPENFAAHALGVNARPPHPRWAPLTPGYLASREKRESPHPRDVMQLTGAFAGALAGGNGAVRAVNAEKGEIVLGADAGRFEYAAKAGGARGGARSPLYLTAEHVEHLKALTNSFLSQAIARKRREDAAAARRLGGTP